MYRYLLYIQVPEVASNLRDCDVAERDRCLDSDLWFTALSIDQFTGRQTGGELDKRLRMRLRNTDPTHRQSGVQSHFSDSDGEATAKQQQSRTPYIWEADAVLELELA